MRGWAAGIPLPPADTQQKGPATSDVLLKQVHVPCACTGWFTHQHCCTAGYNGAVVLTLSAACVPAFLPAWLTTAWLQTAA